MKARYISFELLVRNLYEQFNIIFLYHVYAWSLMNIQDKEDFRFLCNDKISLFLKYRAYAGDKLLFGTMKDVVTKNTASELSAYIQDMLDVVKRCHTDKQDIFQNHTYSNAIKGTHYNNLVIKLQYLFNVDPLQFISLIQAVCVSGPIDFLVELENKLNTQSDKIYHFRTNQNTIRMKHIAENNLMENEITKRKTYLQQTWNDSLRRCQNLKNILIGQLSIQGGDTNDYVEYIKDQIKSLEIYEQKTSEQYHIAHSELQKTINHQLDQTKRRQENELLLNEKIHSYDNGTTLLGTSNVQFDQISDVLFAICLDFDRLLSKHSNTFQNTISHSNLSTILETTAKKVESTHGRGKMIIKQGNSWQRDTLILAKLSCNHNSPEKIEKSVIKYSEKFKLRNEGRLLLDKTKSRKDHQQDQFELRKAAVEKNQETFTYDHLTKITHCFLECCSIVEHDESLARKHYLKFFKSKTIDVQNLKTSELIMKIQPYVIDYIKTLIS